MENLLNSLLLMLNEMSPYILLGFLIAGLLHAFMPQGLLARHLSGRGWKPVVKAAAAGVPLPLCSCGVLPTAVALRRNGASRAASTSFLIATPQTGVDSIAATWSLLGPAFAVVRPVAALVTALFGGVAVGKSEEASEATACAVDAADERPKGFGGKLVASLRYGFVDLVGSIGAWLVAGLIIAALITAFVPEDALAALGSRPLIAMIAVVIVAIPMYVCATGSIPIAMSLMLKGLSPGTALVLLMAGPAANFASFTLIAREMGRKAAAIYVGAIVVGAIGFGLLIDYLLPAEWFRLPAAMGHDGCCHVESSPFQLICSEVLVALLLWSLFKRFIHTKTNFIDMTAEYQIEGMNCPHCQAAVTRAILAVEGVTAADVNLHTGKATVEGNHSAEALIDSVNRAGFTAKKP